MDFNIFVWILAGDATKPHAHVQAPRDLPEHWRVLGGDAAEQPTWCGDGHGVGTLQAGAGPAVEQHPPPRGTGSGRRALSPKQFSPAGCPLLMKERVTQRPQGR